MRDFTQLYIVTALLWLFMVLNALAAGPTTFKVQIENISGPDGQTASDGSKWPFALSPGIWVVHGKDVRLFTTDKKDTGMGLEAQAEDGDPAMLAKSLEGQEGVMFFGVFNTPVGADKPGPITPGGSYVFTFPATPGARLSFALMFGQSNDLFYSPKEEGIKLFNEDGTPASGDITSKVTLWDAGTEVNQEPGIGPDQAPRQKAPNTGTSEGKTVRAIKDVKDGFAYPKVKDVMRVTITPVSVPVQ
jgi:hypothetical protein